MNSSRFVRLILKVFHEGRVQRHDRLQVHLPELLSYRVLEADFLVAYQVKFVYFSVELLVCTGVTLQIYLELGGIFMKLRRVGDALMAR